MITGSSSSNNYTSGEIFSNLMALAAVPTAVAALKTVKGVVCYLKMRMRMSF
jgi:hypothetical protein